MKKLWQKGTNELRRMGMERLQIISNMIVMILDYR